MDKLSYALGMVIGRNLKGLSVTEVSTNDFISGMNDVLAGQATAIGDDEASRIVQQQLAKAEAARSEQARQEGEAFLKENAQKENVAVTASGLQYTVLAQGSGRRPTAADRVKCHYEGRLIDGIVFDSSYRRGQPATFPLSGVIAGWTEGLQLMAEGAKFRFFIPQQLGYGANGAGQDIPPYATLVFDVELLEVL